MVNIAIQKIRRLFHQKKELRFLAVGCVGALIEILIFTLLFRVTSLLILSNIIAFHIAFFGCYFLHLNYTHGRPFIENSEIFGGLIKYTLLMYFQLAVGTVVLSLFIEIFGINALLSKVLQIGIVTPFSYFTQNLYIFKGRLKN